MIAGCAFVMSLLTMIDVLNNGPQRPVAEAVFFPFDSYNVPLHAGVAVNLASGRKHTLPVLARGEAGAVDEHNLRFYGSVIEIDGRFHIWYLGGGSAEEKWVGDVP